MITTDHRPRPLSTSDLAVVVQGPRGPLTAETVRTVRLHLPGARIVLSTWEGAATDDLDVDEVVTSRDPGGGTTWVTERIAGPPVNTDRMVVSTRAGLLRAERPWVLKLRTDSIVDHAGVLSWFPQLAPTSPDHEWRIVERLVGVSSVYTRNPLKTPTGCFHPADTIQFGACDDLLTLWDAPPMPVEDMDFFPDPETRPVWSVTSQRYYPEQWMFLTALRRRYVVEFDHRAVYTAEVFEASNRALAQNFLVLEPWQLGVRVPHLDAQLRWTEDPVCVMTHPIWQQLRDTVDEPRPRPWDPPAAVAVAG